MDRFAEQLIGKLPDRADYFKRGLIAAGEILILALLVMLTLWAKYSILLFTIVAAAGSFWLVKYLWEGTDTEYEYIVTNDDLDVDKIIGKRKRKRMITIGLKTATALAPYLNETDVAADVTVVAHDGSGEDLWYLSARSEKYGDLLLLFNPNEAVRENLIGGFEPILRAKLGAGKQDDGAERAEQ
ncbi:MAG: hypothetical protein NC084_10345 [Bacteroides sp.]|nr:hypothetical protein [Eubacterium sp.]MCM1418965.1 hypothetical protein [Roseburia sp.]MCM1463099.1 hypothetical protein [Bacteroides sp.]